MNVVVGTVTPVRLPVDASSPTLIQNLGAGIIYVDGDPAVTTSTGVKIGVGIIVTVPTGPDSLGALYAISDTAATNVRILA